MKANRFFPAAVFAACFLLTLPGYAQSIHARFGLLFSDEPYAEVLSRFVDQDGMVDYAGLKADRESFDRYLIDIMGLYTDEYDGWDDPTKIAFLLNTYNAITLKTIIDFYPIEKSLSASVRGFPVGIRHIKGAWDKNLHTVMGLKYTLDQIEHEILRKEFREPRIHMALVCAAKGCPPLRNEPYQGSRLDEQLNDQARRLLAHPDKFRIDHDKKVLYLSPIFEWFGEDFLTVVPDPELTWGSDVEQSIVTFLGQFISSDDFSRIRNEAYTVSYLDYDWALNEQD